MKSTTEWKGSGEKIFEGVLRHDRGTTVRLKQGGAETILSVRSTFVSLGKRWVIAGVSSDDKFQEE